MYNRDKQGISQCLLLIISFGLGDVNRLHNLGFASVCNQLTFPQPHEIINNNHLLNLVYPLNIDILDDDKTKNTVYLNLATNSK